MKTDTIDFEVRQESILDVQISQLFEPPIHYTVDVGVSHPLCVERPFHCFCSLSYKYLLLKTIFH